MSMDDSDFYRNLMRAYIDSANDGIFVLCDEMKFHVANPVLESWLGTSEDALTEHQCRRPITDFIGNQESARTFVDHFHTVLTGEPVRFECLIHPPGAADRCIEIALSKVDLEVGHLFIGVARDVTERKRLQAEIEHRATHDHMTGLINRYEFEQRLNSLLESARRDNRRHALLYMDLDQFKVVNDTCGHMAGDILLSQISSMLKDKTRANDTLARLGGDEFGLLLEDCSAAQAAHIAEVYRQAITDFHFAWESKIFKTGVSIGLVPITSACESALEAMSAADTACYVSKGKGGNHIHIDSDDSESRNVRGQMHWVAEINRALHEDRFRLYQQKILPIANDCGGNVHYEILLRMLDEDGNIIPPTEFIPAAERFNLMPAVDRWVIETLFAAKGAQWRDEANSRRGVGHSLCAINLSGTSMNDAGFPGFLHEKIEEYGIPADFLCFEITETAAIGNIQKASHFINEMKSFGCRFSLDDFGSGMSSFAYLNNLAVDFLKIDGSLVRNVVTNPVSRVMVEAINKIGHAMGINTIAEYVEDAEILRQITEIGVDCAQGYDIHEPEPFL